MRVRWSARRGSPRVDGRGVDSPDVECHGKEHVKSAGTWTRLSRAEGQAKA